MYIQELKYAIPYNNVLQIGVDGLVTCRLDKKTGHFLNHLILKYARFYEPAAFVKILKTVGGLSRWY